MWMKRPPRAAPQGWALLLTLLPSATAACPVCDGPTGQAVRAGLFNERLGAHLAATLLPFALLAVVVLALHFGVADQKDEGGPL